MAESLSSLNAESGVVVEFVPSTALPSIPGGLRTVGLIGKGKTSKTERNVTITRGGTANTLDSLSPKALSLPGSLVDENLVTYTEDVDYSLSLPTSVSASAPATSTTAGDTLSLNINSDGAQTIVLATSATGAAVAADIQAKVRSLTAATSSNQDAYDDFTAEYTGGLYVLTSGTTPLGTVVVTGGTAATALKLGTANSGVETQGGNVSWVLEGAAVFTGSVDVSATAFPAGVNLDGKTLQIYINGSTSASNCTFVGTALTSAQIAAQLTAALPVTVTPSVYTSGLEEYIRLTTTATTNASIQIGNGNANSTLGFVAGLLTAGPAEPAAGVTYSFDYETPKVTADYAPALYTNLDDIVEAYGEVSATNTLSLASEIVFENSGGTGGILTVQVDPADGADLAGFQAALSKMATVDGVNIVVPLSVDPLLYASVKAHVVNSSAPLEKKERTAILGLEASATVTSAIAQAQSLASGGNGRRLMLVYPPAVSRLIGDTDTSLNGSFLAAGIAGLRINGNFDVAEPLLRKQVTGFTSAATNLLRTDKLRLRNGGVTVVELIENIVRLTEDTTTDRTTADSQEFAVTEIVDFVARTIRRLLDSVFIGTKVLPDTPSLVSATVTVLLNNFIALKIINAFTNVRASVNALDPRQIDVSFEIQPVRTLRFMKVTFSI